MVHSFAAAVGMFLLGVPRLGVSGTGLWTGVCWGSEAAGILPLAFLQTGGGDPSQAAQLLLLHCFTAGVGGRNLVVIFFLFSLFLTDLLIPSYKGSRRHSREGE